MEENQTYSCCGFLKNKVNFCQSQIDCFLLPGGSFDMRILYLGCIFFIGHFDISIYMY